MKHRLFMIYSACPLLQVCIVFPLSFLSQGLPSYYTFFPLWLLPRRKIMPTMVSSTKRQTPPACLQMAHRVAPAVIPIAKMSSTVISGTMVEILSHISTRVTVLVFPHSEVTPSPVSSNRPPPRLETLHLLASLPLLSQLSFSP
jgi:hypothetical protein